MIDLTNKTDCCGCNACGDICAKHAITFKTDIEGFWYPEVDKELCVDCGMCERVCPIGNIHQLKKNDLSNPECYAAENKNIEVVFDSTSGGIFSALADIVYKDNGYVGGAIFNEDYTSVSQYISNDKKDLPKLRSSKYLQSSFEGFFIKVRDLVKKGENVLVCGSPCQMAALRSFLMCKDYPNLIIVDYVCRGINSPKVWKKYIESFYERYGSKVIYNKAKSKEFGWRKLTQKVILEDGRHIYEPAKVCNYTKGYLGTNAYCRPSCYECKFKGYPRISDITLGDFWGVEKVAKTIKDKDLGTSLVMVNSEKGRLFFEKVKAKIRWEAVSLKSIEPGNIALLKPIEPTKVDRVAFFKDLDTMTFTQLCEKYIISGKISWKGYLYLNIYKRIIGIFNSIHGLLKTMEYNPKTIYQFFRLNTIHEIVGKNVLVPTPHTVIDIAKNCTIEKHGCSILGRKKVKGSKLETRLIIEEGGKLILNGPVQIFYGADIEIFKGATLSLGDNINANIGFTCIAGNTISIGDDTQIGRNVTIRDNNGNHYINQQGYKESAPVIIGKKCWLCEQCTIINGVKIGDGAIVGAKSFVITRVPAHSLVSGHPAEVIDDNVLWKY